MTRGGGIGSIAAHAMRQLRILFVTPYVPSLLRTRPHGFIRYLSQRGHRVSLVSAASSSDEAGDIEALRADCADIAVVHVPLARSLWNCARGIVGSVPFQALYSQSPALSAALRQRLAAGDIDLVHVEHLRAARLGLEATGVPRVFDAVDSISALFENAARHAASGASRWRARLDVARTRRYEGWLVRQFDAALVTSEGDRRALLALEGSEADGEPLAVIPNGVDLAYFSPVADGRAASEIVFVGRMSYHANVAAALRLVTGIMPLVWARHPQARVTIVGAEPAARVEALARADSRVRVTGRVDDVRPYLRRATLAVCPLVYAAGIQNKVLEAMACGTPVVASAVACEALSARPGEHLERAEDSAGLAHLVLRLLDDPEARARLGAAGRRYVEAHHDWNWVVARLEELYQSALARNRERPGGEEVRGQR